MYFQIILFLAAASVIAIPFIPVFKKAFANRSKKALLFGNIAAFTIIATALCVTVFSGNAQAADAATAAANAAKDELATGLGYIAAALATGMSTIAAGIAVAAGATAAIGATSEDPKMLTKGLIFVALGEGIALYGLLTSFMILNKLG